MREYWQLDLYINNYQKTRFFYGTEAAARRRTRQYKADRKNLRSLSKSRVEYLKIDKKTHFIVL